MTVDFKFNIGDTVYFKQEVENYENIIKPLLDKNDKGYVSMGELRLFERMPHQVIIVGRDAEECHGGIQIRYKIRVGKDIISFFEFELVGEIE